MSSINTSHVYMYNVYYSSYDCHTYWEFLALHNVHVHVACIAHSIDCADSRSAKHIHGQPNDEQGGNKIAVYQLTTRSHTLPHTNELK